MREIRTYGLKRGLPHWTIQGGMPYSTATRKGFLILVKGNYETHAQKALVPSRGIMSRVQSSYALKGKALAPMKPGFAVLWLGKPEGEGSPLYGQNDFLPRVWEGG